MLEIKFPSKFHFLVREPAPIKVLFGGRGGAKTESISLALIILCSKRKLRVGCFRELQTSIAESVKETIENRIRELGLESEWVFQTDKLISKRTGSEFLFFGLRYNINKIKSIARIDIAWVEEANNVSKVSWQKLGPSIRGKHEDDPTGMGGPFGQGPEIWISFNPELDSDETYKRFVLHRDQYCPEFDTEGKKYSIVVKVNHTDNPFFPPDLRRQMLIAKAADEMEYLHVWEGHTKQTLEGAIFAKEIKQMMVEGRLGKVPYNPAYPVFTFWDLGHSDHTAIWFVQRIGMFYNVIDYYQNHLEKLGHYLEYMQSRNYTYSTCYQPHDADNETLAGRSISFLTRKAGFKVIVVKRPTKKINGINAVRTIFPLCNFDEENTLDGMTCLRRYCYKINEETGQYSKEPDHNEWSHGADAFQALGLSLKTDQETQKPKEHIVSSRKNVIPFHTNANSWMS